MDNRTVGGIGGIVGPVLFVTIFTIEGSLRPGYDAWRMYLSELSLGPRGIVQIINIVLVGVLSLLFARGVAAEFPTARGASIALHVIGVGLVGAGLFVMDPLTTPLRDLSWHGVLHGVFGAPPFYAMPTASFLLAREFGRDPQWRPLRRPTLAVAAVTITLTVVGRLVVELQRHGAALPGGAIQRADILVYFAWQIAVAARLLRPRTTATESL
jgi:hypothetical membrane protein